MINCQVTQYGKVKEDVVQMNGLVFCDNHGIERSNHMDTSVVEASLKEWHYDKFGIMNQHFRGKADQAASQSSMSAPSHDVLYRYSGHRGEEPLCQPWRKKRGGLANGGC